MIISFTGPDGTGKTTLAKLVARRYLLQNYNVHYIRFKSHHLGMYLILKLLILLKIIPKTNSPRILDYYLFQIFGYKTLFFILELVNSLLWLLLNVKLVPLITGKKIIIAERYIPDFIVSILFIRPKVNTLIYSLKIFSLFMKNSFNILLLAYPRDIMKRKPDEQLETNYIYLLTRLYSLVISYIGANVIINTSLVGTPMSFYKIQESLEYSYQGRV